MRRRTQKPDSAPGQKRKVMNMKYLLSAAAASALMAGTAFAGNIEPAPMEPIIAPAPAPMSTSPNWTGFYVGGEIGYADVNGDVKNWDRAGFNYSGKYSANGDGLIGGVVLGYDYDMGDWVVGAGADYDWLDVNVAPGLSVDTIWRAKLRAGYKLGNGLLYATGGYANADTNVLSDQDGYFLGAGYEHMLSENFSVGGEVLWHRFDNFKGDYNDRRINDYDADVTTAQVRATFRF